LTLPVRCWCCLPRSLVPGREERAKAEVESLWKRPCSWSVAENPGYWSMTAEWNQPRELDWPLGCGRMLFRKALSELLRLSSCMLKARRQKRNRRVLTSRGLEARNAITHCKDRGPASVLKQRRRRKGRIKDRSTGSRLDREKGRGRGQVIGRGSGRLGLWRRCCCCWGRKVEVFRKSQMVVPAHDLDRDLSVNNHSRPTRTGMVRTGAAKKKIPPCSDLASTMTQAQKRKRTKSQGRRRGLN